MATSPLVLTGDVIIIAKRNRTLAIAANRRDKANTRGSGPSSLNARQTSLKRE